LPHEKITLHDLDVIVRQLDNLPALPAVAARVLELTDPDVVAASGALAVIDEVTTVLATDQSLAARLLWLANSSASRPVRTVSKAVRALGIEAVRAAVLNNKICEACDQNSRLDGLDRRTFWRHSLSVAFAARLLAERIELPVDGEEVFLAGLFHDIGKLLLSEALPRSYARTLAAAKNHNGSIAEWERKTLGVDHLVAGRRLAQRWHMGSAIENVIWLHHQPSEAIPASLAEATLVRVVALADSIAHRRRSTVSSSAPATQDLNDLARAIGIDEADISAIATRLDEQLDSNASLLCLADAETHATDSASLAQAGAELGRLAERMSLQQRRMSVQADAFVAVNDFAAGLSGESRLPDVLLKLAETFSRARPDTTADKTVVAYSLDVQAGTMLAVRLGSDGRPGWRTFALAPGEPDLGLPDNASAPTETMSRLLGNLDAWDQWADIAAAQHIGLACQGHWLGGVICPSEAAGASRRVLAGALGLTLALVQQRNRAEAMSEELAGASQLLADTREALAEARTLAAMGELATGAGHELNTPLAVVSGRAQIMRQRATSPEERNTWQTIADQAQRISDIITDLMDFAKPAEPRIGPFEVAEVLAEATNSFSSSDHPQAKSCRVDIQTENDLPAARADREQVRMALSELIANAAASPARLIVLSASADAGRRHVLVKVQDDGPGMDNETLARAYTPFFSAHKAGRRRGLGLPKAKRYVENNGGSISIDSEPGKGTVVSIRLPAIEKEAPESDANHDNQQDSPDTGS